MCTRPKWLRDESGRNWCVLGGVGEFHGIPREIVDDEEADKSNGVLVIAHKKPHAIDVFSGKLKDIVENIENLKLTKDNHYKFNIKIKDERISVNEIQSMELNRILTISRE